VLQQALRRDFVETVDRLTGRRVITFISGSDPKAETSSEVFVLESPGRT
jgi:hypothetical protein